MTLDFGQLPPEVTSGLMYSGPGSSSLVAAASAWNSLAAELASTAQGYDKVVLQLAGEEWLGPSSAVMAAAVQPYVAWMTTTAGQAEQAAAQAQSAAAAFETAFASVVPPPLIAANRAELTQAVQTNVLGLNNGIIAQLESQYAEMWAQDAAAMFSYAGSSAAASKVTPFISAPQIANPAASSLQSAATAAAERQLGRLDPEHAARFVQQDHRGPAGPDHALRDDEADHAGIGEEPSHRNLVPVDRADHLAHQPWHAD